MKKKKNEDDFNIPHWLRFLLLTVALLYLIWILFLKSGPQRQDFPVY